MLLLPLDTYQVVYKSCCGKDICSGCTHAMRETGGKNMKLCPFCKAPPERSTEEEVKRLHKLMEKGNGVAFNQLAGLYGGVSGKPKDWAKANELYLKAGELGYAGAYYNLGNSYYNGHGVEVDKKKAKHYWEIAAMKGSLHARHNLGAVELEDCNYQRAFKHYILAAKAGHDNSLGAVKQGFMKGDVTKDEYANTLREYQNSQDEVKSKARDKARAIRGQK